MSGLFLLAFYAVIRQNSKESIHLLQLCNSAVSRTSCLLIVDDLLYGNIITALCFSVEVVLLAGI